jgi:hypothetical protein
LGKSLTVFRESEGGLKKLYIKILGKGLEKAKRFRKVRKDFEK